MTDTSHFKTNTIQSHSLLKIRINFVTNHYDAFSSLFHMARTVLYTNASVSLVGTCACHSKYVASIVHSRTHEAFLKFLLLCRKAMR